LNYAAGEDSSTSSGEHFNDFAVWRKVRIGRNAFKFFHGSSQQVLVWALKFSAAMPI
jgi:hypothetical protein